MLVGVSTDNSRDMEEWAETVKAVREGLLDA